MASFNGSDCRAMTSKTLLIYLLCLFFLFCTVSPLESNETSNTRGRVPALIVFGDSTVDPGNNNYIPTEFKANHPPYGRDFIQREPTGRYSNGKLATDFIARSLGLKETLPAYLDPSLTAQDLLTGVSFASAGSGYDNLTTDFFSSLPLWTQLEYFKKYRSRLVELAGEKEASNIISKALYVCSIGTNDIAVSYNAESIRRRQYTVEQYQDFMLEVANGFIHDLHSLGARTIAFLGLPPVGCLPLERTLEDSTGKKLSKTECVDEPNQIAVSYNRKLVLMLAACNSRLPQLHVEYIDIYNLLSDILHNFQEYGFEETEIGCCGRVLQETWPFCNEITPFVCSDASKYVFWDFVHPTQKTYEIMANIIIRRDLRRVLRI